MLFLIQVTWVWRKCKDGHVRKLNITGCAVAQHCYKGDVSFLREKWKFWLPVKSKPLNRLTNNLSGLIMSTRGTFVPNLVKKNPFTGDFWAKGWNITFCVTFLFLFFSDQRREETPGRILTRNGSKAAESRKDVPYWDYKMKNWNLTPIYPPPKPQKFGPE